MIRLDAVRDIDIYYKAEFRPPHEIRNVNEHLIHQFANVRHGVLYSDVCREKNLG